MNEMTVRLDVRTRPRWALPLAQFASSLGLMPLAWWALRLLTLQVRLDDGPWKDAGE